MRVRCGGLSRVLSSPWRPPHTTQPLLMAWLGEGPRRGSAHRADHVWMSCSSGVDLTHLVRALGVQAREDPFLRLEVGSNRDCPVRCVSRLRPDRSSQQRTEPEQVGLLPHRSLCCWRLGVSPQPWRWTHRPLRPTRHPGLGHEGEPCLRGGRPPSVWAVCCGSATQPVLTDRPLALVGGHHAYSYKPWRS